MGNRGIVTEDENQYKFYDYKWNKISQIAEILGLNPSTVCQISIVKKCRKKV
jgi:hypothetical protein